MVVAASPRSRALIVLSVAVVAGVAAPLAAFAVVGWFSRYAADDYCTAGQVVATGFWQAQSSLYVAWSGRFAATALITMVELFGPGAVPLLPTLALLAWLAAVAWASAKLAAAFHRPIGPLPAVTLAAVLLYTTLRTTADLPQVLYWQTGLLTYLAPLVLATVHVGWLAHLAGDGSAHVADGRDRSAQRGGWLARLAPARPPSDAPSPARR